MFDPPLTLQGGHRQTLLARFMPRAIKLLGVRHETFVLLDGDVIEGVWSGPPEGPIAIVLHGLAGSFASPYVQGMMLALNQVGYRTLLMHFRGCGRHPNRLARFYHGGDTGDMAQVVEQLQAREGVDMVAVGFSLGANALLKWLGEQGRLHPLKAAAAISVPFDLAASVDGMPYVYERWLLSGLKRQVARKWSDQGQPKRLPALSCIHRLRTFDDQITAPLHGFVNANDYYHTASCQHYLATIERPTLIVHAQDDPFVPPSSIPECVPDCVDLRVSQSGGHVGFVAGLFPFQCWYEAVVANYLRAYQSGD